jgi:hypothetical protein
MACSIPNVQNLNLDGCIKECKYKSGICLDTANYEADQCSKIDNSPGIKEACYRTIAKQVQACYNNEIDCVTECIADAERLLGKKTQ